MAPKPFDYLGKARGLRAKLGREKKLAGTFTIPTPQSSLNGKGYLRSTEVQHRVLGYKEAKECEEITDSGMLDELVTSLRAFDEVALDTETYPQDDTNSALDPRRGRIRLISVAQRI